jgi:hypothetical protein
MLLGLLVVGLLIVQYLQLLGETRDAARFAARDDIKIEADFDEAVHNEFFVENTLRLEPAEVAYAHHLLEFSVGISGTVGQGCIFDATIQPTHVYSTGLLPPYVDAGAALDSFIEAEQQYQCDRYRRQPADWYRQVHTAVIVEAQYPNPSALELVPINWFDDIVLRAFSIYRKL